MDINLKWINNFINVKLTLITISVTTAYYYIRSDNNLIIKKKYDNV